MKRERYVIRLSDAPGGAELPTAELIEAALDGRTFQVHVKGPRELLLIPVEISAPDARCSVVIGGERCGERAGHAGKHCWAGGD